MQGFLEGIGMLAETGRMDYEDLLSALSETLAETDATTESMAKSASRKSSTRQSIVAQIWRKPSISAKVESTFADSR